MDGRCGLRVHVVCVRVEMQTQMDVHESVKSARAVAASGPRRIKNAYRPNCARANQILGGEKHSRAPSHVVAQSGRREHSTSGHRISNLLAYSKVELRTYRMCV